MNEEVMTEYAVNKKDINIQYCTSVKKWDYYSYYKKLM